MKEFPAGIYKLHRLQTLHGHTMNLKAFPAIPAVKSLWANLLELDISANPLACLPQGIGKHLVKLEILKLNGGKYELLKVYICNDYTFI